MVELSPDRDWCSSRGQTTTEYLMVAGLMASVIVTVVVLYYWHDVKQPSQTMARCVGDAVRGSLAPRCGADSAVRPATPSPTASRNEPPVPASVPPPAAAPVVVHLICDTPDGPGSCFVSAIDPAGGTVSWREKPGFAIVGCPRMCWSPGEGDWPNGRWIRYDGRLPADERTVEACTSAGVCTTVQLGPGSI